MSDHADTRREKYEAKLPSLKDTAPSDGLESLGRMLQIRYFEEEVQELFAKALVRGSTHLCNGQEAVSVGVCTALRPGDTMTCTYRGHGAAIAMGAALDQCFGEILGRAGGVCGGKGGSMHLTDVSVGAFGSHAIVGAHLPIALGLAFAEQYQGADGISVCFFGDGATNIGAFHESLNMASVWRLPVLFVIENNHYGEYSPLSATTGIQRLAERAASYGMPGIYVDGNDIVSVRAVTESAAERARQGGGPTLIEADTYRQVGHSRSDPGAYRPAGELERWKQRDPILLLEQALQHAGIVDSPRLDDIRGRIKQEVREAKDRALSWPEPSPDALLRDVFA